MRAAAGTVVSFDGHVGLGEVESAEGTRFPFHCTAIVGGGRVIDVGTVVRVGIGPGRGGRWEALWVEPV